MCSINSEEIPESVIGLLLPVSDKCRKCGSEGANIILRTKDFYCNNCFLIYFIHKFRSTIGKSRQIKPGDKILIPFFKDLNSIALLHLIRQGLDEDSHKRLRFEPSFLFIDDSIINPSNSTPDIICDKITQLKFPWYYVRLEDVMEEDCINPVIYNEILYSKNKEKFLSLFSAIKCQTDKEDYILHLLHKLICISASKLKLNKIFLPDNCTDISIRILSHIALGRGAQLPEHVGFKSVHMGVCLYRPMRELLQDEVEHYLRVNNEELPRTQNKCSVSNNSIQSCTESFINGLQKEFKSTVPTVLKIGDKVQTVNHDGESSIGTSNAEDSVETDTQSIESPGITTACAICGFKIDTDRGNTSAYFAQVVSEKISIKLPPNGETDCSGLNVTNGVLEETKACNDVILQAGNSFCYGCKHLLKNLPSLDVLPEDARRVIDEHSKEKIRKEIIDFLL